MAKGGNNWSQTLIWPAVLVSVLMIVAVLITADQSLKTDEAKSSTKLESLSSFRVNWGLPKMTVTNEQGELIEIALLAKTDSLLTIWTSTCAECKTGLIDLQKYHEMHPELAMILFNYRDTKEDATAVLTELGITIPNYYDEAGESYEKLQATIPASYYFKDAKFYYYFPGRVMGEHLDLLLANR